MAIDRKLTHNDVKAPLYSPAERAKRDATPWTLVQAWLAPLQFLAFAVSLALVMRFIATGEGMQWAIYSVVVKTLLLYAIMITGCIWEKEVFGVYLFAPAFYLEDLVSMLVLALHTAYLAAWIFNWLSPIALMWLALIAYTTYVINAAQYIVKFKRARQQVVLPALVTE